MRRSALLLLAILFLIVGNARSGRHLHQDEKNPAATSKDTKVNKAADRSKHSKTEEKDSDNPAAEPPPSRAAAALPPPALADEAEGKKNVSKTLANKESGEEKDSPALPSPIPPEPQEHRKGGKPGTRESSTAHTPPPPAPEAPLKSDTSQNSKHLEDAATKDAYVETDLSNSFGMNQLALAALVLAAVGVAAFWYQRQPAVHSSGAGVERTAAQHTKYAPMPSQTRGGGRQQPPEWEEDW